MFCGPVQYCSCNKYFTSVSEASAVKYTESCKRAERLVNVLYLSHTHPNSKKPILQGTRVSQVSYFCLRKDYKQYCDITKGDCSHCL